ncbi:MAG: RCC1 repeat-containing protein, partial [Deltaproteobacteria bacterium]|nr:RCC1 repeat-containing protein [Deltaproteobacteria bacterium]
WGNNYRGQLGNGTTIASSTPVNVIGLPTNISKIDAGINHTCAFTSTGSLKCWGRNEDGELGDGTTINRLFPVDVQGLTSGVLSVSAGGSYDLMPYAHTCSILSGGRVKCWGHNGSGQLGVEWNYAVTSPVEVQGLGGSAMAVEAGWDSTCALTVGGGLKCWGSNRHGRLGDGTTNSRTYPGWVSGMTSGITSITSGDSLWDDGFSCAMNTGGGLKCWGSNNNYELGDGTNVDKLSPVTVSGLSSGVRSASAGGEHACVVTSNGGVKCWGRNSSGQLGDGTNTNRSIPVNVVGLTSGISGISTGNDFTCVLTSAGGVKCWGYNSNGQLGDGTTTNRWTPVDVLGLTSGVIAISAGETHTCAVTNGGIVKCWGDSDQGKLGNGSIDYRTAPQDVTTCPGG